jgi:hypothetical protein
MAPQYNASIWQFQAVEDTMARMAGNIDHPATLNR